MALKGTRATVLGAGGAARAVAVALGSRRGAVTVCARQARRRARGGRPGRRRTSGTWPPRAGQLGRARQRDLRRQRRAGRRPDGTACRSTARSCSTSSTRRPGRRSSTRARSEGCLTIGGIEMLVAQAERQFELWTGQRPPAGLFRAAAARRNRRRSAASRQAEDSAVKQTTFEEFVDLARRGTFVPVVKEIIADLLTPVSAFLKIAEHSDYAFLFESVEGGERVARYSFLGKDPFLVLRQRGGQHRSSIDRA